MGLHLWPVLAACLCLTSLPTHTLAKPRKVADPAELLEQLKDLRLQSSDGVLRFNDDLLRRFGSKTGKTYSLVVFLSAQQVLDNPQLNMLGLRKEFALMAQAHARGPQPDSTFFVDLFFEEAPQTFRAVEARQVPFIFRLPPETKMSFSDGSMKFAKAERMQLETVQAKYPWDAQVMVDYYSKVGLEFGPVIRPTLFNHPLFPLIASGSLAFFSLVLYVMWRTRALHHPFLWALGSLAVLWFSVSGGMFNIIRGMPLYVVDRSGKMQFFLPGSRNSQLGAEGFIMGAGYMAFSFTVALLTWAVPKVANKGLRTLLSYALMVASGYLVLRIGIIYMMKTGYQISSYLF